MGEQLYDIMMITLFVVVPEVFLILSLRGIRSMSHELSNDRFFESSGESVSWQLLILVAGIFLIRLGR